MIGFDHLERCVNDIADEQRPVGAGLEPQHSGTGRVTGSRLQHQVLVDTVAVTLPQHRLVCLVQETDALVEPGPASANRGAWPLPGCQKSKSARLMRYCA